MGIGMNRKWRTESGEEKEDVTFLECEAWGRTAEMIGQYFRKGRQIALECRLKMESWEDKQTHQKRSKIVAVVEAVTFTGTKEHEGSAPASRPAPAAASSEPPPDDFEEPPF